MTDIKITHTGLNAFVEKSDEAIDVYAKLLSAAGRWVPEKNATCFVHCERLTISLSEYLNLLFSNTIYLYNSEQKFNTVLFQFKFDEIENGALDSLFNIIQSVGCFPKNTYFSCSSAETINPWVDAISIGVVNGKLSDNTTFDLSVGTISSKRDEEGSSPLDILLDALVDENAPNHLQVWHKVKQKNMFLNSSQLKAREVLSGAAYDAQADLKSTNKYQGTWFRRPALAPVFEFELDEVEGHANFKF